MKHYVVCFHSGLSEENFVWIDKNVEPSFTSTGDSDFVSIYSISEILDTWKNIEGDTPCPFQEDLQRLQEEGVDFIEF